MGIPSLMPGSMVGGKMTLALKCDSSWAARYEMLRMVRADGTVFGLAVMMPGTSVQISTSRALTATAKSEAV